LSAMAEPVSKIDPDLKIVILGVAFAAAVAAVALQLQH
jgi:hypothetical protein